VARGKGGGSISPQQSKGNIQCGKVEEKPEPREFGARNYGPKARWAQDHHKGRVTSGSPEKKRSRYTKEGYSQKVKKVFQEKKGMQPDGRRAKGKISWKNEQKNKQPKTDGKRMGTTKMRGGTIDEREEKNLQNTLEKERQKMWGTSGKTKK